MGEMALATPVGALFVPAKAVITSFPWLRVRAHSFKDKLRAESAGPHRVLCTWASE